METIKKYYTEYKLYINTAVGLTLAFFVYNSFFSNKRRRRR